MMDPKDYDDSYLRDECAHRGMIVDEGALEGMRLVCSEEGVSQHTFDRLTVYHAQLVYHYFTPGNYSFWQRVKFAAHFLRG